MSTDNAPDLVTQEPTEPAAVHPSRIGGRRRRQRRFVWLVLVLSVVSVLTALFAFGLSRDPTVIHSPLLGRPAPDFSLTTLDGARTVRLSEMRGQVVVVNFWASWCAACHEEHPNLIAAWERYRDQGVVLVGIDYNDERRAAMAFMRELGGDWPVVGDPGGRTALAYGVYGVPETFFVSRRGVVAYKQIGPSSYALLTDQIQRLLDERG